MRAPNIREPLGIRGTESLRKDEKGTILVEFVAYFWLFYLLIISILSLVNIVTAQARVHYALTETASTVSMYNYIISAGIRAPRNGATVVNEINETLNTLNKFKPGFAAWEGSAPGKALAAGSQFYYGSTQTAALKGEIERMFYFNLAAGSQSGEDYLRSVRITNVKLTDLGPVDQKATGKTSVYRDHNQNIKLSVEYEIDYSFMGLPIPFVPKLHVAQSVMTRTWYQMRGYYYGHS